MLYPTYSGLFSYRAGTLRKPPASASDAGSAEALPPDTQELTPWRPGEVPSPEMHNNSLTKGSHIPVPGIPRPTIRGIPETRVWGILLITYVLATIYHIPYTIYDILHTAYRIPYTINHIPYTMYHIPFMWSLGPEPNIFGISDHDIGNHVKPVHACTVPRLQTKRQPEF